MVWIELRDPNYYRNVSAPTTNSPIWRVSIDEPCPTVMASGMRSSVGYLVSDTGEVPLPPNEVSSHAKDSTASEAISNRTKSLEVHTDS